MRGLFQLSRWDREFLPFSLVLRDKIENLCFPVSCFETRTRIFSYNLMFRDKNFFFQSRALRRDWKISLLVSCFDMRTRISVFKLSSFHCGAKFSYNPTDYNFPVLICRDVHALCGNRFLKPSLTIVIWISKTIEKPLSSQWSDGQKTFNGDGTTLENPLKTIGANGDLKKNINHSISLKKLPSPRSILLLKVKAYILRSGWF